MPICDARRSQFSILSTDFIHSLWRLMPVLILLATITGFERPALAADDDFHPFIGKFVGEAEFESAKGTEKRQIEVVVRPTKEGFSLRWTTISEKASGKTKEKSYYAAFKHKGPNTYRTTEKDIDFGNATGAVYANIYGKKMTVVAFLISPAGRHEVQKYERELVPGGMKLTFTREFDGVESKAIEAMLRSVPDDSSTAKK